MTFTLRCVSFFRLIYGWFFIYLDALFGVLNGTEKEGPVDQRISIVYQHHFLAQDARHVGLLVSGERGQNEHSRVIVAVLSFVFNLQWEREKKEELS